MKTEKITTQEKYKFFIRVTSYILVMISLYFIANIVIENYENIAHFEINITNLLILFLLLIINSIIYVLFSLSWLALLRGRYENFHFIHSFRIIALSQIGKYLPGNVGHFVGRFYLAKEHISKQDITYTIFVEQIMLVAASLLIGSFYVYYFDISKYISFNGIAFGLFVLICMAVLVPLFLRFIRKKVDMLKLDMLTISKVFFLFCAMVFGGGLTIYVLTLIVSPLSDVGYIQCVSGFAISFLVGFVVPGAPGGIGVREYSFVLLFTPFLGELYALQIIIMYRFVTIGADLLVFGIGKILNNKKKEIRQ